MSIKAGQMLEKEQALENTPMQKLIDFVQNDLESVQDLMQERSNSHVPLIPKMAGHTISAGGKNFRALLTLAIARACGYEGRRHIELASCIEFIHNATLLHDDVIDESTRRRGVPSANALWGDKASILVGDFLFTRAFELMVGDGSMDVLAILSRTASLLIEGEVQQLTLMHDTEMYQETYLQIIQAKTARLFSASCEIGGVIAKCTDVQKRALAEYGMNLGMAFQLVDDILDYKADPSKLGKDIGVDFREGKMTLPVIYAYQEGNELERQFWSRTMEKHIQNQEDLTQALVYLRKYRTFEKTLDLAKSYVERSQAALSIFGTGEPWNLFHDVVSSSVQRSY